MPNVELLQRTMQHIKDHPEEHNQRVWACGTAACFAGRAALMSGWTLSDVYLGTARLSMTQEGAKLLGLTEEQARILFNGYNTAPMLELMVKDLVNGDELHYSEHYRREVS